MSGLSDRELQEIEERAAGATEGPWVADGGEIYGAHEGGREVWNRRVTEDGEFLWIGHTEVDADAEFIAAARTDVPRLVAVVRGQAEEIQRLRDGREESVLVVSDPVGVPPLVCCVNCGRPIKPARFALWPGWTHDDGPDCRISAAAPKGTPLPGWATDGYRADVVARAVARG